jgi:hypothetical protein
VNEEWKDVRGFGGRYQVSTMGRVKSGDVTVTHRGNRGSIVTRLIPGKILRGGTNKERGGYMSYALVSQQGAPRRSFYAHRLVADAFVEGRTEEKCEVNHINFDKLDNRAVNLEWVSRAKNMDHAYSGGRFLRANKLQSIRIRGTNAWNAKLTEEKVADIRRLSSDGRKHRSIAAEFGINVCTVNDVVTGRSWSHVKS